MLVDDDGLELLADFKPIALPMTSKGDIVAGDRLPISCSMEIIQLSASFPYIYFLGQYLILILYYIKEWKRYLQTKMTVTFAWFYIFLSMIATKK